MPHYSVATSKDNLSSLIDKALAGEEVVITRHGKPMVALHAVQDGATLVDRRAALERLRAIRETLPRAQTPYLHGKAMDETERDR